MLLKIVLIAAGAGVFYGIIIRILVLSLAAGFTKVYRKMDVSETTEQ